METENFTNWCEKCGKKLNPKKIVWLELSNTDGKFYETIPTDHISQGGFAFGVDCAKTELKQIKNK